MLEHPPLELLQFEARLDPELLAERLSRPAVELERVGLAARAVERQHQLRPRPLAERLARDELLQLGDQARVPPEREVGLDPLLERGEPSVLEPRPRVSREGLGLELGERCAAPELERLGKALSRGLRVAGDQELAPLSDEALEAIEIELALFDAQRVARRLREQPICPERFSQLRDVALEGFRRGFRRLLAPEVLGQPADRNNPVTAE